MDKREYKELSELAANGGTKAFARLYETLYREMYYTAFYSLCDEPDTVEVIISTARDTMSAIGKLHTEEAFRSFMMRTLCARIRSKFREYSAKERRMPESSGSFDVRAEFARLGDTERLVASMYIGGKFQPDEISAYSGLSPAAVKKKLESVIAGFELD